MTLDFSNEVNIECSYDRRNYKKDNNFLFLNELLLDVKGAQELYRTQLKNKHKIKRFNIQNDCNYVSILESKQCEDKSKNINSSNSFYLSSDDLICEKQNEKYYSFSTLSIVIDSKVEYNS